MVVSSPLTADGAVDAVERTYAQALNEALRQELARDSDVVLMGEDIGIGGVFTVTSGLLDEFGHDRVIDTPIAEAGFIGVAAGAAVSGARPVVELMFVDFTLVAADQLFNQIPKLAALSNGKYRVPLTIRTQQGIAGGGGPQHSQSLEALFAHIPGFAVALPYTPDDAKGLLTTAIRMDEPTIVIENKALYFTKGDVPTGEHLVPFGKARIRRQGDDVTLVAYSQAVGWCLQAAERLESEDGISAEVVDLRTIVPLDMSTVAQSVSRTRAAVMVQESSGFVSLASEVAAQIAERCWGSLSGPVQRVCGLDLTIPYSHPLERRWLPSVDDIVEAARRSVAAK
jgi:pyruvate/2-oxoglutarate/acetoin dehydrogenase E1 component